MLKIITEIATKKSYWIILMCMASVMELTALYYQYALDEWPCVLCIHIRIWLMALIGVSISALLTRSVSVIHIMQHGSVSIIMAAMLERSWILLGVERGTIFGSCDMNLGLPAWFALDKWLPFIFEVKTACGYTPVLFLNITMAEALLVFSFALLIISLALSLAAILHIRSKV